MRALRGVLLFLACSLATAGGIVGCIVIPGRPMLGPHTDTDTNGLETTADANNSTAYFQPEPRGVPFYKDLRPETDGTEGGDWDVDMSPDGSKFVFSSTRHTIEPKVFLRDTATGALYQKTSGPGRDIQPKFSPDGKWIAFASDRDGNFDILIVPADRNEAYWQLTSSDADEIHPTWSPDGKRIAYSAREGDSEWALWLIDLDGQRRSQLGPGLYPEWSPDGAWLAFQRPSQRGRGWYGIWIVEVEGGSPREIATDTDTGFVQPSWSPNSRRIVFATVRETSSRAWDPPRAHDLWVVDLDTGHRHRLTADDAEDYAPAWSLDERIYFTSHRGGSPRIWSLEPAGSPPAKAPAPMPADAAATAPAGKAGH